MKICGFGTGKTKKLNERSLDFDGRWVDAFLRQYWRWKGCFEVDGIDDKTGTNYKLGKWSDCDGWFLVECMLDEESKRETNEFESGSDEKSVWRWIAWKMKCRFGSQRYCWFAGDFAYFNK